ncbi:hypothetical protein LWC34_14420 [Kibdelosporangium philippinense]|uniref:Broad-specificity NMP kinase n=1 Tax=Kibdelosporangium philippinense TaxID=211113 RepID=A0ABS8ZBE9_9PSEU|nr:hypothetical protein [Kibdelosporangium philippinense]MCE7004016.1 hypothetical protein [Kibdelosporangium philippinense]
MYDVLLIGGPSGVGKSSVGWEVAALLKQRDVPHCFIEGDTMDQIHPAPPGDPHRSAITERNIAAVWANYAAVGQTRLIYTNTVSILEAPMIVRAMGEPETRVMCVLLTASEETVRERLTGREIGSELDWHIERSAKMARRLDAQAPEETVRILTDGLTVEQIAEDICAKWL